MAGLLHNFFLPFILPLFKKKFAISRLLKENSVEDIAEIVEPAVTWRESIRGQGECMKLSNPLKI